MSIIVPFVDVMEFAQIDTELFEPIMPSGGETATMLASVST